MEASTEVKILRAAEEIGGAFAETSHGGRHAGMLRNYAEKSIRELEKAALSLKKRIAEHRSWISHPDEKISEFQELDSRHQRHLVNEKWPADVKRLQEQREIVEGLLPMKQRDE